MKKIVILMSCSLVAASAFALPDYEPFSGAGYTTSAGLAGLTDAGGQSWFQAGSTSGAQPTIAAGDLTIAGLYTTGGGQSAAFGGNGGNARFNWSIPAISGGVQSGSFYYSLALKLTDLTVLNATGVFIAGLNNAQGAQTGTPNTVVDRLQIRSAGAGLFNIGLGKGSSTSDPTVWGTDTFSTSDTIFVVGSYTFNTGSGTDDLAQLWINPAVGTFGAGSAPAPTLSNSTGTDIARVFSFVLYDRSAAEPTGRIDDLRGGQSWADVTPAVPEPATLALGGLALMGLGLQRIRRKRH